jgi:ADP-ribose pyrophosphatase YjhB (NUDIX family)
VGAVGAIFNDAGQVLLVEHIFRPHYPWGLPGGWVERAEDPAEAVRRELEEELKLQVEVKRLLLCERQGGRFPWITPPSLGLVFYGRLADHLTAERQLANIQPSYEVLALTWIEPEAIQWELAPLERKAIFLAKAEFEREQARKFGTPPINDQPTN